MNGIFTVMDIYIYNMIMGIWIMGIQFLTYMEKYHRDN